MKRNHRRKPACHITVYLLSALLALSLPTVSHASESGRKKLKLGTSFSVAAENASYESSDEEIAYVNAEGLVTGKRRGKVTIRIKRGDKIRKRKVTVVANGKKKKGVEVCTGEMILLKNVVTYTPVRSGEDQDDSVLENTQEQDEPRYRYFAVLEIQSDGAEDASKVTINADIAGQKERFSFGQVKAGESSTAVAEGEIPASQMPELAQINWDELPNGLMGAVDCRTLNVYSAGMYTSYDYKRQKTSYHWGTADTKPPVIKGFVGKNSFNQKMPYQVIYSGDAKHDFFRYVSASDDREGKVALTVNTKKINFRKPGIYKITYIAKDKAGNVSRKQAKVELRKQKAVDVLADKVLSVIIKKNWSTKKKAIAIYNYTRKHILYVGVSSKNGWEQEAIHGIRSGRGDCYTYYAVARALLTRAGIPNIEVKRYRGAGHHWWNMVYVSNGWYHYDCGPRIGGGRFCLLTDAQLTGYSKTHGNKYIWNYRKIPKSPKKKLTRIF